MKPQECCSASDRGAGFRAFPIWGMIAIASALVCLGGFAAHGFGENGLRLGSELTWRFTVLAYFAAAIAGPVTRLVPGKRLQRLGQERRQLLWGFCASFGVFLASLLVPNTIGAGCVGPSRAHRGHDRVRDIWRRADHGDRLCGFAPTQPGRAVAPRHPGRGPVLFLACLYPERPVAYFRTASPGRLLRLQSGLDDDRAACCVSPTVLW